MTDSDATRGHREIHQATGMVSVQAAVGLTEALLLLLLRARAYAARAVAPRHRQGCCAPAADLPTRRRQ